MQGILFKILEEPQSIIALSALVISIFSLLLTFSTSYQNRMHNRLGVRPIAYILPKDYENNISVILQNKGTGPLITKQIQFKGRDGEKRDYLMDYMPALIEGYFWTTFSKAQKVVLLPSEEKILMEFKGDVLDLDFIKQRDKIREILGNIEINITYTSIYNEKKPFEHNYKLSWYNRSK